MKVEEKTITSITLTELERLDPITIMIDQKEPKKAEMTIKCYGKSWTYYWGGMGYDTLGEFYLSCDNDYLARCLRRSTGEQISETDWDEIPNKLIKEVLTHRRDWNIDKDQAREAYSYIKGYCFDEQSTLFFDHPLTKESIWFKDYGSDWYLYLPTRLTHDYQYLLRIIEAVRQAFIQLKDSK
jgi:hypothetical protein